MGKVLDVGVSYRTPGKHDAMSGFLGKTVGVMKVRYPWNTLHVIDCTAGDGEPNTFSGTSSPEIIQKHIAWLNTNGGRATAVFFERSPVSASALKQKTLWPVFNVDASEMQGYWSPNDFLFVVNDPNTMSDWALPGALRDAPKMTVVFSTLGCNVGGLKRLPKDQRQTWYNHVGDQLSILQHWHDALLVTLEGDKAQWAYLVNAPKVWRSDLEKTFTKAFTGRGHQVRFAWVKSQPVEFGALIDELFLTKKERQA
jgi:hypothetical protein